MNHDLVLATSLAALLFACGGSQKGASDAGEEAEAMPELSLNEPEPELAEGLPEESGDSSEEAPAEGEAPQFEPGMSVDEATSAAPFLVNAVEVDISQLEAPLLESGLYAPCTIPSSQHYKMKVAVYKGEAVGIDVTTDPASKETETCIRKQIETVRWEVSEDSVNLVELTF